MSGRDLAPAEVAELLTQPGVVLVDVREPAEFAANRIAGAINMPLSRFDPAALPPGRVILHCGVGKRSAMALAQCPEAVSHMEGGVMAWHAAGLPVER